MRKFILLFAMIALAGCNLELPTLGPTGPEGRYALDKPLTEQEVVKMTEQMFESILLLQPEESRPQMRQKFQQDMEKDRGELTQSLSKVDLDLELKPDGTWQTSTGLSPEGDESSAAGTWKQDNEKLLLTRTQRNGQAVATPKAEEALLKDGSIYLQPEGSPFAFVFSRR